MFRMNCGHQFPCLQGYSEAIVDDIAEYRGREEGNGKSYL